MNLLCQVWNVVYIFFHGSYFRGDTIWWIADILELLVGILVKCIPIVLNYFGKGGKMQTRFIGKSMYFDVLMCGKWDERVDKTVPQLCVMLLRDNCFCCKMYNNCKKHLFLIFIKYITSNMTKLCNNCTTYSFSNIIKTTKYTTKFRCNNNYIK